jgi:hypothetical protein
VFSSRLRYSSDESEEEGFTDCNVRDAGSNPAAPKLGFFWVTITALKTDMVFELALLLHLHTLPNYREPMLL